MPNWTTNEIIVNNPEITKKLIRSNEENRTIVDFNMLIPMPDYIYMGGVNSEIRAIYGENNWYDWSIKHWNTKWNAVDSYISDDRLAFSFDTAWEAPYPIFQKLCEMFPDDDIFFYCEYEEGLVEEYENRNGELVLLRQAERSYDEETDDYVEVTIYAI